MINLSITLSNRTYDFSLISVSGNPVGDATATTYALERGKITLSLKEFPDGASISELKHAMILAVMSKAGDIIPAIQAPQKIHEWQVRTVKQEDDVEGVLICSLSYEVWDNVIRAAYDAIQNTQ